MLRRPWGVSIKIPTRSREISGVTYSTPVNNLNERLSSLIYSDIPGGWFRLVTIKPGSPKDIVECTLEGFPLNDCPPFEALSYTWGDELYGGFIYLENQRYHVTANLWQALVRLRSTEEDRRIWIDALAINQSNTFERNLQVQSMKLIFQSARRVVVWIGELPRHGSRVFDLAVASKQLDSSNDSVMALLGMLDVRELSKLMHHGLHGIVNCEYWYRIWVMQELALAQDAVILCGDYTVAYNDFARVYNVLAHLSYDDLSSLTQASLSDDAVQGIMYAQHYAKASGPSILPPVSSAVIGAATGIDMVSWLQYSTKKFCADKRDYIYGFYSCFPPAVRDLLPVDYSLGIWEVYKAAAEAFVKVSGSPRIVCWARNCMTSPDEERPAGVPTWVPNFSSMSWDVYSGSMHSSNRFSNISCSLPSQTRIIGTGSGSKIQTQGVQIGHVRTSSHILDIEWSPVSSRTLRNTMDSYCATAGWDASGCIASALLRCRTLGQFDIDWLDDEYDLQDIDEEVGLNEILKDSLAYRSIFTFGLTRSASRWVDAPPDDRLLIGVGPHDIQVGDMVCVLFGCSAGVILRRAGACCYIVGDAYIDGFMNGEAVAGIPSGEREAETFCII